MAIYQSIHSGEYIDEQISAVSQKLPLTGGTVNGTIEATQFVGPLEGTATQAAHADHADVANEAINATNATSVYAQNNNSAKFYVLGTSAAVTGYHNELFNNNIYVENSVLMGAAWNDYAEYRRGLESIEAGYCVSTQKDGQVFKTNERLQYCEGVVSDTFGFAIGKTLSCNIPLAVSGRVLAHCGEDRNSYNIGDCVCAGPEGKIFKMSRDEIKEYPDRIVGTISEIPEYQNWGVMNVPVDNRVWIKVK